MLEKVEVYDVFNTGVPKLHSGTSENVLKLIYDDLKIENSSFANWKKFNIENRKHITKKSPIYNIFEEINDDDLWLLGILDELGYELKSFKCNDQFTNCSKLKKEHYEKELRYVNLFK